MPNSCIQLHCLPTQPNTHVKQPCAATLISNSATQACQPNISRGAAYQPSQIRLPNSCVQPHSHKRDVSDIERGRSGGGTYPDSLTLAVSSLLESVTQALSPRPVPLKALASSTRNSHLRHFYKAHLVIDANHMKPQKTEHNNKTEATI